MSVSALRFGAALNGIQSRLQVLGHQLLDQSLDHRPDHRHIEVVVHNGDEASSARIDRLELPVALHTVHIALQHLEVVAIGLWVPQILLRPFDLHFERLDDADPLRHGAAVIRAALQYGQRLQVGHKLRKRLHISCDVVDVGDGRVDLDALLDARHVYLLTSRQARATAPMMPALSPSSAWMIFAEERIDPIAEARVVRTAVSNSVLDCEILPPMTTTSGLKTLTMLAMPRPT